MFSGKVVNPSCSVSSSDADGSGTRCELSEPDITIYQQTSNLACKKFQCYYL